MWLSTSILLCVMAGADDPAPVIVDPPQVPAETSEVVPSPQPIPYQGSWQAGQVADHDVFGADCPHCGLRHRCCRRCGGCRMCGGCPSCGRMLHAWLFGSCDMPQHVAYILQEPDTYYFRPYNVVHLAQHQNLVRSVGGDPRHPYINTIFERVYQEWEEEQAAKVEVIPAPKAADKTDGARAKVKAKD